jgi:hypothetical protein
MENRGPHGHHHRLDEDDDRAEPMELEEGDVGNEGDSHHHVIIIGNGEEDEEKSSSHNPGNNSPTSGHQKAHDDHHVDTLNNGATGSASAGVGTVKNRPTLEKRPSMMERLTNTLW